MHSSAQNMLNFFGGKESREYKIIDRILIGMIILIALYHISHMKIKTPDQMLIFYVLMLEIIGVIYEYYN